MKHIAIFIALGSIVAGIIVLFLPPVPCESTGPVFSFCFNKFGQVIAGLLILVLAAALSILIHATSSRHRALAIIGSLMNFVVAAMVAICGIWVIHNNLPVSIVMVIEVIGFICAGLSANFIKETFLSRETESSS